MDVFEQNLWTIARYPIQDAGQWYAFCDFVAAVGAGEIVNNPATPAVSAIRQSPHNLILAITRLRNSGYELLQRVPVRRLTAPPNHFSSMISTLKVYGANRTADAVKGAAYTFWQNIENVVDTSDRTTAPSSSAAAGSSTAASSTSNSSSSGSTTFTASPTPSSLSSAPRQITEQVSTPWALGLSAATIAGVIWYIKTRETI